MTSDEPAVPRPSPPPPGELVRGRHYTAWLPAVEELAGHHSAASDAAALDLLSAVLDAVEAEAAATGTPPPAAWYERVATLHHRRGDRLAELAVLRRCAAVTGGSPALDARLLAAEAALTAPGVVAAVLAEASWPPRDDASGRPGRGARRPGR
jgi:hypothetical protein